MSLFSFTGKKGTNCTCNLGERFTDTSFLRNRVVNANGDQDEDDDDDDDHMESSRIIYPSENKAVSFMSSMSQIPSYAYGAVTAPFKKPDHVGVVSQCVQVFPHLNEFSIACLSVCKCLQYKYIEITEAIFFGTSHWFRCCEYLTVYC